MVRDGSGCRQRWHIADLGVLGTKTAGWQSRRSGIIVRGTKSRGWRSSATLCVLIHRSRGARGGVRRTRLISQTLLPDLSKTSLSIIIRPSSGLEILSRLFPTPATGHEPHGVWFQPGADDSSIAEFVRARGLEDKVVLGGRCVLVDGDMGLQAVAEEKNEGSKL